MKRRALPMLVIVVLVIGIIAVMMRRERPPAPRPEQTDEPPAAATATGSSATASGGTRPDSPREQARARRDALREQILRALANAQAGTNAPPPSHEIAPPPVYPPGNLHDRIGGRDALAASLNKDFMPLAHECIDRAQKRVPGMRGMLALGIETVADRELGAVVEAADAAPNNEIGDPDLLECIRESALSLRLPPPPANGREKFMITLPIEPEGDAGR